ncbi:unnamed protein product [Adineta ricciae]|uniref:Uncharacterized protein n=1 Tax=Adineta ricciae TaxID=249248 RepID=A0A815H965_ADIRI|nr:unnamed protein product [Adineta ricciae]CAF1351307.1 unnamed protein product [Adineta ricciae]
MHSLSLIIFAVVLIIALQTLPASGKAVKSTAATTTVGTTTTKLVVAKVPEKAGGKPVTKVVKKKKKSNKKAKKPKQSPWKVPDADQKKLFNDYKAILRTKLTARVQNISATYQLEPAKYGLQTIEKTVLHHFLIKLPDSKYAHAVIWSEKDAKKPLAVNESHASIKRTIYDNLQAAEA